MLVLKGILGGSQKIASEIEKMFLRQKIASKILRVWSLKICPTKARLLKLGCA